MYEKPTAQVLWSETEPTMNELLTESEELNETDNTVSIEDLIEGLL